MRIKKYVAKNMREALIQIKDELGEEAIILKTRKLPKKVFGLGNQDEVEVTAAIDEEAAKPQNFQPIKINNPGVYNRPRSSSIVDVNRPDAPEVRPWKPPVAAPPLKTDMLAKRVENKQSPDDLIELKQNVNELKSIVSTILKKESAQVAEEFSGSLAQVYRKLINAEIKEAVARQLAKNCSSIDLMLSESQAEKKIIASLTEAFPVSGPLKLKKDGPVIVVFVGPTGAGKTTTLAKLAAHCCVNKHKNVSIITADTYRIAAIEQIRMFADIVKVGLQVIFSPEEVPDALAACSDNDIVFVDTAGRSQRNTEHMGDLSALIESLHPDEIHLVLSATTKDSDLSDMIQRYKNIKINRLLFTKLDETVRIGNIFNIVHESRIPVSYFTCGQSVPDDIELAQAARFVQQLMEGASPRE